MVHQMGMQGCALLIVMACRHDMGVRDIKETERFICYVLDNASTLAEQAPTGDGKIRVLFDLSRKLILFCFKTLIKLCCIAALTDIEIFSHQI